MRRSHVRQTLHYLARPHTGLPEGPLRGPAAFRAGDFPNASYRDTLSEAERDELLELVRATRRFADDPSRMRRRDVPLPRLGQRLDHYREVLTRGRGFVVFGGMPVEAMTTQEAERVFWALGLHLGLPGAQNPKGDLLGHVRDEGFTEQLDVRGYRTRAAISFHCDAADVVGLFCLEQARSGGRSRIASSVSVYNVLRETRPDLARALFSTMHLDTKSEGGLRHVPVIPSRHAAGTLRTFWHSDYFRTSERFADAPRLSEVQRELIDAYERIAGSEALCIEMTLAPGDVQLLSNHVVVHGRTAFEDALGEPSRRHLLRLWLSTHAAAPRLATLRARVQMLATFVAATLRQRDHA